MNNLLLILALLALSSTNTGLLKDKDRNVSDKGLLIDKKEGKKQTSNRENNLSNPKGKKIKKIKKIKKSSKSKPSNKKNTLSYNLEDVKNGIKLMDLSEEDLDRGMEIITRTKKYMSSDERKILIKMESILDLIKGIKKLNDVDILEKEEESEFFRTMDEEDKKNMMIKEILEVFPEKRKESLEKAIDMKKKIDLFAELFLPDSDEEGGFSLSSLADIGNLGSVNNIKLLGSLLRGDDVDEESEEYEDSYDEESEDDYYQNNSYDENK